MSEWKLIGTPHDLSLSEQKQVNQAFLTSGMDRPHSVVDTININQILYQQNNIYILYPENIMHYYNGVFVKKIKLQSIVPSYDYKDSAIITNYNHIIYLFIAYLDSNKDLVIIGYDMTTSNKIFTTNISLHGNKVYSIHLHTKWIDTECNLYIQLGIHNKPIYAYLAICIKTYFHDYSLHYFSYRFSKIWTSDTINVITPATCNLYFADKKSSWKFLFGSIYYKILDLSRIQYQYKHISEITSEQESTLQQYIYHYELSGYDTFIPTKYNIYNNDNIFMYNIHKKQFLYKTEFRVLPIPITIGNGFILKDIYISHNLCLVLITKRGNYNYYDTTNHISHIYILDISKDFLMIQHLIDRTFFSNIIHCCQTNVNYSIFVTTNYNIGNCGCIYMITLSK
jgi:hypothetical protein